MNSIRGDKDQSIIINAIEKNVIINCGVKFNFV